MRRLRIAGIVVAVLVALPVLALAVAWLVFDPNEHKDRVQAAFREATGRELRLAGPLSVSIFPWLAVESGRAAVANRDGFGDQPFASFDRARLGLRLWPLLTARRLEVGPVRVDGLAVNLAVARDGRNNWSDVVDRLEQGTASGPASAPPEPDGATTIARVELRDARVSYTDDQAGTRYAVAQWQLEAGPLERGAAVDVETSLRVVRAERDFGHLSLRTRLDLTEPDRVVLAETSGQLHLPTERRPDGVEVDLRSPRIELQDATREISVRELEARLGEAVLATSLHVVQGETGPRVDGDLRLAETDLRKLLGHLGIEPPRVRDAQALGRVAATSKLAYSSGALRLDGLALTVGDVSLTGRADVRPGDPITVRFDLRGSTLDADRFLPPPDAPEASRNAAANASAKETGSLDIGGSLTLESLVVAKLPLQQVRMDLRLRDGRVDLAPLRARAYGGSLVTRLRYAYTAPEPTLSLQQELSGVDVAALLGQRFDVKQLQGRANAKFSLTSSGADGAALFTNLRGPYDVEVTDGAVLGVDLWYELERAVAAAQLKAPAGTGRSSGRTPFDRLSASGTLAGRTLHNERVEFVSDVARVRGRGAIDYGRNALDLDLTARLLKAPQGRLLGVKVSRAKDADIPLQVTGTLAEPKVRPDVSKLLEAMAKDAIKEPLEGKIKDELEKIFKF